jgi:hypothetical protein
MQLMDTPQISGARGVGIVMKSLKESRAGQAPLRACLRRVPPLSALQEREAGARERQREKQHCHG